MTRGVCLTAFYGPANTNAANATGGQMEFGLTVKRKLPGGKATGVFAQATTIRARLVTFVPTGIGTDGRTTRITIQLNE